MCQCHLRRNRGSRHGSRTPFLGWVRLRRLIPRVEMPQRRVRVPRLFPRGHRCSEDHLFQWQKADRLLQGHRYLVDLPFSFQKYHQFPTWFREGCSRQVCWTCLLAWLPDHTPHSYLLIHLRRPRPTSVCGNHRVRGIRARSRLEWLQKFLRMLPIILKILAQTLRQLFSKKLYEGKWMIFGKK